MVEKSATPWGAAAGFWLFVSVMYAGQIWWLSRLPGEQINVRQAITWQTTYFLLWITLTLLVWRMTSPSRTCLAFAPLIRQKPGESRKRRCP